MSVSFVCGAVLAVLIFGSVSESRADGPTSVEDLEICDCLLPGKVKKLGRNRTFVTRRRPIRTTVLDCEIRGGEYVVFDRADYRTALSVWLPQAEAGDAEAQNFVGEIMERGLGIEADYAGAAVWYAKAAKQGFTPAQINLGFLYEKGLGVDPSVEQALHWYRKASGGSVDLELSEMPQDAVESREATRAGLLAGPTIEMIEPAIIATRGVTTVPTGGTDRTIVGRVRAPAGLLSLLVNGTNTSYTDAGLFKAAISVTPPRTEVSIVVIDEQGKRDAVEFMLDAEGKAAANAVDPVVGWGIDFGRYRALVIGNNTYPHLPDLKTAVNDASAISEVLTTRYGFDVQLLIDATRYDILSALNEYSRTLEKDDRLLVYYAGHGQLDETLGRGYWLPVDAEYDNTANWISNQSIGDYVRIIPANHILLISDSCFSGALTRSSVPRLDRTLDDEARREWYERVLKKRSRVALASGGLTPVLDSGSDGHSVFSHALLDVLRESRDVIETRALYGELAARVAHAAGRLGAVQEPEYAPVRWADHEGGDFLFVPIHVTGKPGG